MSIRECEKVATVASEEKVKKAEIRECTNFSFAEQKATAASYYCFTSASTPDSHTHTVRAEQLAHKVRTTNGVDERREEIQEKKKETIIFIIYLGNMTHATFGSISTFLKCSDIIARPYFR